MATVPKNSKRWWLSFYWPNGSADGCGAAQQHAAHIRALVFAQCGQPDQAVSWAEVEHQVVAAVPQHELDSGAVDIPVGGRLRGNVFRLDELDGVVRRLIAARVHNYRYWSRVQVLFHRAWTLTGVRRYLVEHAFPECCCVMYSSAVDDPLPSPSAGIRVLCWASARRASAAIKYPERGRRTDVERLRARVSAAAAAAAAAAVEIVPGSVATLPMEPELVAQLTRYPRLLGTALQLTHRPPVVWICDKFVDDAQTGLCFAGQTHALLSRLLPSSTGDVYTAETDADLFEHIDHPVERRSIAIEPGDSELFRNLSENCARWSDRSEAVARCCLESRGRGFLFANYAGQATVIVRDFRLLFEGDMSVRQLLGYTEHPLVHGHQVQTNGFPCALQAERWFVVSRENPHDQYVRDYMATTTLARLGEYKRLLDKIDVVHTIGDE